MGRACRPRSTERTRAGYVGITRPASDGKSADLGGGSYLRGRSEGIQDFAGRVFQVSR